MFFAIFSWRHRYPTYTSLSTTAYRPVCLCMPPVHQVVPFNFNTLLFYWCSTLAETLLFLAAYIHARVQAEKSFPKAKFDSSTRRADEQGRALHKGRAATHLWR